MDEFIIFAAKFLLVAFSVFGLILFVFAASFRGGSRAGQKSELEMTPLHEDFKDVTQFLSSMTLSKAQRKIEKKTEKKRQKQQEKEAKNNPESDKSRLFVLEFEGDVKASQVEELRKEVSALLLMSKPKDEVLLKLESPGGMVTGYGLAASQLKRIREKGLQLTIAVDKVAASGGYMMACVGSQILAAPFAVVGSIGVVAQVPNFNRLLKKNEVDYKEYTAGDYKRTVSLLGEITAQGEKKFLEQLEDTHVLFKDFVTQNRPQADMKSLGTGEHWYGERAVKLNLVDKIMTSDDYLLEAYKSDRHIYSLKYRKKKNLSEKISEAFSVTLSKVAMQALSLIDQNNFQLK